MNIWPSAAIAATVTIVSACSAEKLRPAIDTFSQSVVSASETANKKFKVSKLRERVAEELRQDAARAGAVYDFGDEEAICSLETPLRLSSADEIISFDKRCALSFFRQGSDPDGEIYTPKLDSYDPESKEPPTETQLVHAEYKADLSLRAIGRYASALGALSSSKLPSEIALVASEAVEEAGKAAELAAVLSGTPLSAVQKPVISTGGTLIGNLLGEALEAQRYSMLAELIRTSNDHVESLSRNVASWFYLQEEDELRKAFVELRSAVGKADLGDAIGMRTVAEKWEAAKAADQSAEWRTFWNIAPTHHAIMLALDEPANLDQQIAAAERIRKLVGSFKAFVSAIEKSQE